MAFQTGSAISHDDFFTQLDTFLVANGWVQDELDTVTNDRAAWHQGGVFIQVRWDSTNNFALFQSLSFDGSAPGQNPDDSGNGDESGAITTERRVNDIGDFSTTNTYFFFTDNTAEAYAHIVVEYTPGRFKHFSFGELIKFGDWTGGEYVAGDVWDQSTAAIDSSTDNRHSFLLDSRNSAGNSNEAATVHVEGVLPGQAASTKWGVTFGGTGAGLDGSSNARLLLHGFTRDGFWVNALAWIRANPNNAFVSLIPIQIYVREVAPIPDEFRLLGEMPDTKITNMANFNPKDEVVVGADTWKIFPWKAKANNNDNLEESMNAGIAYKKVP